MNQNLRRVPFFVGLSDDALQAIQERLVLRRYRKGEVVFVEGAVGDSMYLVESGQVAVVSEGKDGEPDTIIAHHGPGSFFGEMALLLGEKRSATIRVVIDAELWQLHKSDLDDLLRQHPNMGVIMSRELSRRLSRTIHQPSELDTTNIIAVLGRKVVPLAEALHNVTGEKILIIDLGGLWTRRAEVPLHIAVETMPDNAEPEALAERLGEVTVAYGQVQAYGRVILALPRQETALTRKAAELSEVVVEVGGRTTPWVKRFARENYWYVAEDDVTIQSISRRIARRRVGLALSSGNARGFAHIGVLRVLEEAQVPIDIVAGTSVGALIGGLYCAGRSLDEIEEIAQGFKQNFSPFGGLWDIPLIPRSGIFRGRKAIKWLESLYEGKTFEQLAIPLRTVAADVITGEEVVSASGSVAEAVRASASIPAILEPAHLNGRYLIDGGSVNPVPVSVLSKQADIIIAVSVIPSLTDRMHRRELLESGRLPNLLGIYFGDREIMEAGIIESRMGQVDVLIQPDVTRFTTFQYDALDELIEEGARAAQRMLPNIQACLKPRTSGVSPNGRNGGGTR